MNQGNLDARITVQYVNPPKSGKKRGTIKDTDGNLYGVFPDKIGLFQPGSTYDVEINEHHVGSETLRNISDAVLCGPRKPARGGTMDIPTTNHAPPVPPSNGYGSKDEQIFVCAVLKEFIAAGEVRPVHVDLVAAINVLRRAWQDTFGKG